MPAAPAPNSEYTYYAEDHVVTGQTITANGNSGTLSGYGKTRNLRVQANLANVTGTTPSYTFVVEDSIDGTNWNQVGAFTAITAAGTQAINISPPYADRIRVRWTVTGTTPSAVVDVFVASASMAT